MMRTRDVHQGHRTLCSTAVWLAAAMLAVGCADDGSEGSASEGGGGGKADEVTDPADFACQNIGGVSLEEMVEKRDPIAELLLKRGEGCPSNYGEMIDKLAQTDAEDCADANGLRTRVVSDNARFGVSSPNYRTVTTKQCGGRAAGEFVWTFLSVRANEDIRNRGFIEMAAFDPAAGMFNYYTLSGGGFRFEADSADLMAGAASCSSCHPSGGLIMKELDEPWVHWELDGHPLPGADELFERHAEEFGARGDGDDLELAAREVNSRLNVTRVQRFADPDLGSVELLLQPLFCAVEINLDTAGEEPQAGVQQIPPDFFIDPFFIEPDQNGIPVDPMVYEGAIADAGQFVPGAEEQADTAIKFVFAERSGIDVDYVQKLLDAGVVDEDFVSDVLSIDFTNPLFSDERCDLMQFAPRFGEAPAGGDTGAGSTGGPATGSTSGGDATTGASSDTDPTSGATSGGTGDETPDPGTCCTAQDGGGCSNAEIQQCVCDQDAFCCDSQWDQVCVDEVSSFGCGMCEGGSEPPPPPEGDRIPISEANPDTIRDAFIAALQEAQPEAGSAAATLLANLQDPDDTAGQRERVQTFLAACADRPQAEFMADTLRVASTVRNRLRNMSIIEHPQQLPQVAEPVDGSFNGACTIEP